MKKRAGDDYGKKADGVAKPGFPFGVVLCVLLISGLSLTAGCGRQEAPSGKQAVTEPPSRPAEVHLNESPEQRVRNTVMLYIGYLIEGYKTLDMTPLQAVASKDRAESAYFHMAALSEGKTRMMSELKAIDFRDITFTDEGLKATVNTEEIWDFAYANIETGETSGEMKDYRYRVTYILENLEGRWMITDTTAEGEEAVAEPAPKRPGQP